MKRSFTRQELHRLVWSKPGQALSTELGVSDVWLSKVCREYDVPRPPRGHWAKLAAGKAVSNLPLPERRLGMSDRVTFGDDGRWSYQGQTDLITAVIGPAPTFHEPIEAVVERVRKLVGKVTIPRDFSKAHGLIAKLLEVDAQRRDAYLAKPYRYSWDAPYFEAPFEKRRLRLMNALMVCIHRQGYHPTMREKNPGGFSYRVGQQDLSVSVDHPKQDRYSHRSSSDAMRPASDPLVVTIYGVNDQTFRTKWEDTAKDKVEAHIEDIAVAMIVAGEVKYRTQIVLQHTNLIERQAKAIEERRQQLEREERGRLEQLAAEQKARIDSLLRDAAAHRQANDIRDYVAAVRNSTTDDNSIQELENWTHWALVQAKVLDPISSNRWLDQSQNLPNDPGKDQSAPRLAAIVDAVLGAIEQREDAKEIDDGTALNSVAKAEARAKAVRRIFFGY